MNAHLGLLHGILPATVDLKVSIPENHPSARNLGSERVGSGTLVDPDGYILTVHYVTLGAQSITVTLLDGEQFPGELAAQDYESGLALVKISGRELPFLRPAPPESPSIGQAAMIVASSGETERRVSGGYVTSTESFDGHWEYMLDKTIRLTAFNPGYGGGTLADMRGRIMGVVSLNLNQVGKFSLAIPIEYYLRHEQELKQYGQIQSRPRRPWLGFYTQGFGGHIVVAGVVPGGPAERSGLREGDIILGVEQKEIRSRPELYREMWKKRPGDRISFRILREEESLNLEVASGDRWDFYRS
ncbi:MAG: serine protease [Deltaproteobacteria bacterium]|nr:serine protease [Deltaproteobacteria bacterium]